jgi:hypothetical protein
MVGFVYLHQLFNKETHIKLLAHLSCAINLKQSEKLLYTVVTDGDAQIIKA